MSFARSLVRPLPPSPSAAPYAATAGTYAAFSRYDGRRNMGFHVKERIMDRETPGFEL